MTTDNEPFYEALMLRLEEHIKKCQEMHGEYRSAHREKLREEGKRQENDLEGMSVEAAGGLGHIFHDVAEPPALMENRESVDVQLPSAVVVNAMKEEVNEVATCIISRQLLYFVFYVTLPTLDDDVDRKFALCMCLIEI